MKHFTALLIILLLGIPAAMAQDVDDKAIASRVSTAITNNEDLKGSDILVVSVHGYVILAGQVLSPQQRQDAAVAAAFATKDIRRLINELQVVDALDYSFEDSDQAIMDQIVAVIPVMSPETVPVIHDGVVNLLGQVTKEEGDKVATTISKMNGVRKIRLSYEYIP